METTIPKPLLFALDETKKHEVLFKFDAKSGRWYVEFEESQTVGKKGKRGSKK